MLHGIRLSQPSPTSLTHQRCVAREISNQVEALMFPSKYDIVFIAGL